MADFSYIAINRDGKEVKGSIQAEDVNQARSKLKMDYMTPVKITPQSFLTKDIELGSKKVKPRDLAIFCRQFTSILNSGVTVTEALRMLADQTDNKNLKKGLIDTKERVQQGETLAEAMSHNPNVFPEMMVNMVDAGEQSGSLDTCVSRMGIQFEKSAKLNGLVRSAMTYPIMVIIIAVGVTLAMSIVVVPRFVEMFAEMGSDLPVATKMVMALSDFLIHKWWLLLLIIVAIYAGIVVFKATETGKEFFGSLALKLPIFGKINLKSNSARFARTMSTLVGSGMGITAAIEITSKAMKNVLYKKALQRAKADVEQGIPISVPIKKAEVFPSMVGNMVAIGEETGNIEQMLDKVAEYYEEETEMATASLTEMLQPIIIVVLGSIVALMVLAMYSPMINMYNDVGNL